ncbi:MAG: carboxylesterase family protein [Clostridia bacterium]|nr:carboxylesterase family protein [Clostridia bacterium]
MEKLIITPCGEIQGTDCRPGGVVAFKGIRYATAGRWEYPRLVTGWDGVYDATKYGNCSYQPRSFYNEEKNLKKIFYYNEFRRGESYTYSEDCLFLNVWTPADATPDSRLPVIVYIHGGGYTGGCGHEKHFDDSVWATKGVVAVTLNYRLGPMGFLCLPELKAEAGHTGNYGLFDQLAAIQWVHDNISAFGGDPSRVTIMGQSAGAMSVQQHCLSPLSEGLFSGAVMSSGCGMGSMLLTSPEKVYPFWQEVMKRAGCESLADFRALPVERLFELWQSTKKEVKGGMMSTVPVKDGCLIVEGATPKKIPYIVGSNSHDMAPPILASLARKWGKREMLRTYAYLFDRMLPGDECGAWHSADLWYWFGTLDNCWRPMEQKDYDLSDQMTTYLCNFAKFGDPNGENQPAWAPTSEGKRMLLLGEQPTKMGKPNMFKLTCTMLTNKAVGE